jgi:hypothetical protein
LDQALYASHVFLGLGDRQSTTRQSGGREVSRTDRDPNRNRCFLSSTELATMLADKSPLPLNGTG